MKMGMSCRSMCFISLTIANLGCNNYDHSISDIHVFHLLQILDRALHPKHTSNDWSTDSGAVQARRGDPVRCLLTFSSAAADVRFRHVQEEEKQWRKMEAYDGPRICSKYLFALKRSRSYRNALTICNFVQHEIFSHSGKNTGIQIQTMFVGKHLDTEIEHCRMVRL